MAYKPDTSRPPKDENKNKKGTTKAPPMTKEQIVKNEDNARSLANLVIEMKDKNQRPDMELLRSMINTTVTSVEKAHSRGSERASDPWRRQSMKALVQMRTLVEGMKIEAGEKRLFLAKLDGAGDKIKDQSKYIKSLALEQARIFKIASANEVKLGMLRVENQMKLLKLNSVIQSKKVIADAHDYSRRKHADTNEYVKTKRSDTAVSMMEKRKQAHARLAEKDQKFTERVDAWKQQRLDAETEYAERMESLREEKRKQKELHKARMDELAQERAEFKLYAKRKRAQLAEELKLSRQDFREKTKMRREKFNNDLKLMRAKLREDITGVKSRAKEERRKYERKKKDSHEYFGGIADKFLDESPVIGMAYDAFKGIRGLLAKDKSKDHLEDIDKKISELVEEGKSEEEARKEAEKIRKESKIDAEGEKMRSDNPSGYKGVNSSDVRFGGDKGKDGGKEGEGFISHALSTALGEVIAKRFPIGKLGQFIIKWSGLGLLGRGLKAAGGFGLEAAGKAGSMAKSAAGSLGKGAIGILGKAGKFLKGGLSGIKGAGILSALFAGGEILSTEMSNKSRDEKNRSNSGSVGSMIGGIAGGAIGSLAGPLGTAVGGMIGSMLGKVIGGWLYDVDWKKSVIEPMKNVFDFLINNVILMPFRGAAKLIAGAASYIPGAANSDAVKALQNFADNGISLSESGSKSASISNKKAAVDNLKDQNSKGGAKGGNVVVDNSVKSNSTTTVVKQPLTTTNDDQTHRRAAYGLR